MFLTRDNWNVKVHQTVVYVHFYVLAQLGCWLIKSKPL